MSAVEFCSCGIGMITLAGVDSCGYLTVSISRLARCGRRWAPATLRRLYARLHPAASAVAVAATAFPLAVAVVGIVVCACGCGGGSARIAGFVASMGK